MKLPFLNDAVSCGGKCVDWRDSSVACRVRHPRGGGVCSLPKGHTGYHVACSRPIGVHGHSAWDENGKVLKIKETHGPIQ